MKTALVFGASGQIGQPLLARLSAAGWRVLAVSRQAMTDTPGVTWLRGHLGQVDGLPGEVDAVFSCGPLDLFARWHAATPLRPPRIVAFGSTSLAGKRSSHDPAERALVARLAEAESSLFEVASARGSAATVLRPTLVYGAGRDASLTRIAAMASRWGGFALPRGATGLRQPVHVDDLASTAWNACAATASHDRSYDLPGGETLPYREMVARVLACLRPPRRLYEVPAPVFRASLAVAQALGIARGLGPAALARMHQDLVFDDAPARRDLGHAPRAFTPDAAMFVSR